MQPVNIFGKFIGTQGSSQKLGARHTMLAPFLGQFPPLDGGAEQRRSDLCPRSGELRFCSSIGEHLLFISFWHYLGMLPRVCVHALGGSVTTAARFGTREEASPEVAVRAERDCRISASIAGEHSMVLRIRLAAQHTHSQHSTQGCRQAVAG